MGGQPLQTRNSDKRVQNVVLVHGAWADGSGWKDVYDILVKDGFDVSIVQEPETSFKEDVPATRRMLALQNGPCVLVAHSYGGAVVTEAGTDPSVAALVPWRDDTQSQLEWIATLDNLAALKPKAVVDGHKLPENDDDPRIIAETQQYLRDFNRLNAARADVRQL